MSPKLKETFPFFNDTRKILHAKVIPSEGMNLKFKIRISYCSRHKVPVVIDARMDDAAWQEADIADNFMQNFPYDSSEAIAQTEVYHQPVYRIIKIISLKMY